MTTDKHELTPNPEHECGRSHSWFYAGRHATAAEQVLDRKGLHNVSRNRSSTRKKGAQRVAEQVLDRKMLHNVLTPCLRQ